MTAALSGVTFASPVPEVTILGARETEDVDWALAAPGSAASAREEADSRERVARLMASIMKTSWFR